MREARQNLTNFNFGGKANMALLALGTILGSLYGMGEDLGLSPERLEYVKMGANFVGLLTGMVFIKIDKKKLEKDLDKIGLKNNT